MAHPLLWTSLALASLAAATCTRASLEAITTLYIQAQAAGNPSLFPLSPNLTYYENDTPTNLTSSLLIQPLTIDFNRSLHDTVACTTFTELTAATNPHPYVIDTKLVLSPSGQISSIESVITDAGDWLFNATSHLLHTSSESWPPIPAPLHDSRAVIQAAADAYLDSWGNGSVPVPYGTPCARLEGGLYTGDKKPTENTCTMPEFPKPFWIEKRSYVVDEVAGAVAVFDGFPFIDTARPEGTSSVNFVRVEGGKIRWIHESTVCSVRNCGR
jgi:hypothetical protein